MMRNPGWAAAALVATALTVTACGTSPAAARSSTGTPFCRVIRPTKIT